MQFSLASSYLVPLTHKYLPRHPIPNISLSTLFPISSSAPYSQYLPQHPIPNISLTTLFPVSPSPPYSQYLPHHPIPNISLSTLFSNTLSLCSSLNVTDQVSHSYRTTGKVIVLYITVFIALDTSPQDSRFRTEW